MFQQPDPPPAGDSSAVLDWIDAVADRFESAWKACPAPRLADFLGGAAADSRSALLQELVKIDLEYRRLAGAPRTVEEYVADFPELLGPEGSLPDDLIVYARRLCDRPAGGDDPGSTFTLRGAGPAEATFGLRCPQCGNSIRGVAAGAREVSCPSCGGSFRLQDAGAAPRPPEPPRTLGRFQLLELLGRGSFGAVYKAYDAELDRTVAVKVPRAGSFATAEEEERFLREAKSAAQLSHPGIVPVHEIGRDGGLPYLVCDYIAGRTLADLLAERRPGFRDAADLVAQAALALDYAHRQGVVHRDVTPRNILLDAAGRPHLTDFGLARRDGASMVVTLDGQVLGTPAYMSPEQAAGEQARVDGRSDVYSLGVILYELLTGELPFRGSVRMLLHQVFHDEPRPPRKLNDRIPRDLETVCLKAMAKEPARRYATAGDLAADLRRHLQGEAIRARPVGGAERLGRWCRRNPLAAGLAAAVALSLLAGTGLSTFFAIRANDRAMEADGEKEAARKAKRDSDYRLYIATMRLIPQAWEDSQTDWLVELLDGERPGRSGGTDLRGFEWHYWYKLCHAELLTVQGPDRSGFSCLASSPDGGRLATGGPDGVVRLWEARSGRETLTLTRHTASVLGVAFSPDGKRLASAGEDAVVRVWDVHSGREVLAFKGHPRTVCSVAFSPDGKRLASASDREVIIWGADDGRELLTLRGHTGGALCVAFSPDGKRLASGGDDKMVKVWDTATGRETLTFRGHSEAVHGVAFSPDGKWLASASMDKTVRLWDPGSGRELLALRGHSRGVGGVAFSPDGKRLASGGNDQTVRTWDAASGREVLTLKGHIGFVRCVCFSPDGSRLTSIGGDGMKFWDATRPQGMRLLRGHTREVYGVAFSPDGRRLASASEDGTIKVWDAAGCAERMTLKGHTSCVNAVAFSPDGHYLASASDDRTARIWDAATGQALLILTGHTDKIWRAAFSPDGKWLATASEDGTVRVWDAAGGREVFQPSKHPNKLDDVAFSPDGRQLASACWDYTVRVWAVAGDREPLVLRGHTKSVWCVAFSPDGRQLASAGNDQIVKVWDVADGRELFTLKGHTEPVSRLAFSPDGERLASAGWDGTVRVWDTMSGQETLTLRCGTRRVFDVAWSLDGYRLAATGSDGAVRLWDATPPKSANAEGG